MLIECPHCQARAKLPDSHEGAKVRCGECGKVYVAGGGRGGGSRSSPGLMVGIGAAVVVAIGLAFALKGRGGDRPATTTVQAEEPEKEPEPDVMGYESPAARAARAVHDAAFAFNEARLASLLFAPAIWAREQSAAAGLEEVDESLAAGWQALTPLEQDDAVKRWTEELMRGEAKDLVADWRPYDGAVVELDDTSAVVRLDVTPREEARTADGAAGETRTVEWRLVKDGDRWKAWSWERWYSPDELEARIRRRPKGYEKVTLSDGSVVHEREPEPLGHLDDTPPELRERIDSLIATMLDLDLTRESSAALREVIEIGRPAIPRLLTKLYETPLDTEENAIRCNLVDQALRSITGFSTGFKPQVAEGSGAGTTEERRQSSIKQWFAWWYRKQRTFTEKEVTDGLADEIELTDKERRWLERQKKNE